MTHTRDYYENKIASLQAQGKDVPEELIIARDNALTRKEKKRMYNHFRYHNDPAWREHVKATTRINCNGNGEYKKKKAKKLCKELADYTCQVCGKTKNDTVIDAHHIVAVADGGSDEQSNLICLCRSCHEKVHCGTIVLEDM